MEDNREKLWSCSSGHSNKAVDHFMNCASCGEQQVVTCTWNGCGEEIVIDDFLAFWNHALNHWTPVADDTYICLFHKDGAPCGKKFKGVHRLEVHAASHVPVPQLFCPNCNMYFSQEQAHRKYLQNTDVYNQHKVNVQRARHVQYRNRTGAEEQEQAQEQEQEAQELQTQQPPEFEDVFESFFE